MIISAEAAEANRGTQSLSGRRDNDLRLHYQSLTEQKNPKIIFGCQYSMNLLPSGLFPPLMRETIGSGIKPDHTFRLAGLLPASYKTPECAFCATAGQESHLLREPLSHLETRLDPKRFVRIHRSTLVNLDRVIEIHPLFHGNCCIVLQDGTQLTMTRNYRENFPHLPDRLT